MPDVLDSRAQYETVVDRKENRRDNKCKTMSRMPFGGPLSPHQRIGERPEGLLQLFSGRQIR